MKEIEEAIKEIVLKSIINSKHLIITPETDLIKDVGMDSVSLIMMVVSIENRFNIELPDEFFSNDNLSSFSNIVSTVQAILNSEKDI